MKNLEERKKRARAIAIKLKKLFPDSSIALNFSNNWEMAVAVILSAQTTDKKVNEITKALFKKYKKLDDYADADLKEFQNDIRQIGLYKGKARNIIKTAQIIRDEHDGKLPRSMEKLTKLPGIGRKTANVILGVAFGKVGGIVVDTHVRRFALKFELTDHKDPKKIEEDLKELLPKSRWMNISYRLIEYGRQICPARPHECKDHPLTKLYPKAAKNWPKAK